MCWITTFYCSTCYYYYCILLCLVELNLLARELFCVEHIFSSVATIFIHACTFSYVCPILKFWNVPARKCAIDFKKSSRGKIDKENREQCHYIYWGNYSLSNCQSWAFTIISHVCPIEQCVKLSKHKKTHWAKALFLTPHYLLTW